MKIWLDILVIITLIMQFLAGYHHVSSQDPVEPTPTVQPTAQPSPTAVPTEEYDCHVKLDPAIDLYLSGRTDMKQNILWYAQKCEDPRIYARLDFAFSIGDLETVERQKK